MVQYKMIRISNTLSVCSKGHPLRSSRASCAYCDGFTEAEFKEVAKQYEMEYFSKGGRIAVYDEIGRKHPMDRERLVNGMKPGELDPEGWYVYYMRVRVESQVLYKIGMSQKPWKRLNELAPEKVWFEYFKTKELALREEQRLIRLHNAHKITKRFEKLKHKGATEFFNTDVLGKDRI